MTFFSFLLRNVVERVDVPLLVLNLGLDIIDGVGRLHLEGDGLPRKGLDEDLHLHERSTSSIASLRSAALTVGD